MTASRTYLHPREAAVASTRPSLFQRSILWLTLSALIAQPVTVSAQVIAASSGAYKPQVGTAQNGVTVVQITAPSGAGVSRNQYQQFDVTPQGVVLNNSRVVVQTQQAGFIEGNANLAAGSARIILNEVTSSLPSSLRGYTEVGGSKAEVIIANPNGITCDGCGFINTSRGVLTTGTPVFGAGGSLDAFRVSGGTIAINGAGLNASNSEQIDLIARAVQINAQLWGQNLNVVTGANQVAYADLVTSPIAGSGAAPGVSIDVALLGGMYANKIRLVSSEAGVGVVNAGNIAAQAGDLSIDSAGRITLTGSTRTAGNLSLTSAGSIANSGTLYAQGNASLSAGSRLSNSGTVAAQGNTGLTADTLDNTGVLGAGIDASGNVIDGQGDLTVSASNALTTSGSQSAGGSLALSGSTLNLAGSVNQASRVSYRATAGDIDHRGAQTLALQDAVLNASGTIDNSAAGRIEAGTTLSLASAAIDNTSGGIGAGQSLILAANLIANSGGKLYSAQDASLSANRYTGDGTLLAERDLAISLDGSYTQSATNVLQANRNLSFSLTGDLINQGILAAVGSLSLSAANIDNQSGATVQGASADLTASHTFSNTGAVLASTLALRADSLGNTGSVFGQDITVNANSLINQGSGVIAASNTLKLYVANTLSNLDGGLLYSAGDLSIAGGASRDARGWLDTPTGYVLNRSASIEAGRDLEITAGTVDNQRSSVVTATRTLSSSTTLTQLKDGAWSSSVVGNVYDNPGGAPYWPSAVGSAPTFTLLANIYGGRRRAVLSEELQEYVVSATPEARMLAGRDIYLRAGTVNNNASRIEATNNLLAEVTTLNNTGYTLYNKTRDTAWKGDCSDIQGDVPGVLGNCNSGWIWTAGVSDTITSTNTALDAVFRGSQTLSLAAVTVTNRTVDAQGLPPGGVGLTVASTSYAATPYSFSAPAGGLYALHSDPGYPYLVETDPRFTQFARFISSDYMLARLGLNPALIAKRLGDGYYEQQLVRDQLINQRGKASLGHYASLNAEYTALLDAGADYARAFEILPGVILSQAQVAALAHDMVWLEERVVDGQRVLVPVVYLAQSSASTQSAEARATGAIIGGGVNTRINAVDLNNSGSIAASGQTTLLASHDLNNDSGHVSGQSVTLVAGNDLHLGTATRSVTLAPGQTFTHEGLAGRIDGENVTLAAGRDLTLAGGQISAGDASLSAGRDLAIGTQTLATEQHLQNGDSRFDRSATSERASRISTSGDLALTAKHDLAITGSQLESGGSLSGTAGHDLILGAAQEQESIAYNSQNKRVTDIRQSVRSSARSSTLDAGQNLSLSAGGTLGSEGATLKAGEDLSLAASSIVLDAAHDRQSSTARYSSTGTGGQQQAQSQSESDSARGSIVAAGRHLRIESSGDTTVIGSALAAGQSATLKTGGNLALLAAQSSASADLQASSVNRKSASALAYSEREVRQLLSTISAGSVDLQIGGNLSADLGEKRADGTLNADRMSVNGIVRGDSRQHVSVTRTGDGADANPATSQVRGNLAAQGIRNGAKESFAPTAANAPQSGQAAISALLQSGLIQIKNQPAVQAALNAPTPNGSALTYKDDSGKVTLTLAGQAKVQAVYSQLQLTETFDVKHFADQGTAQLVTLVAAIALTVCTGGAGAGTLGAALTTAGSTSALMINAAAIAMASTMTGQLAGGASLGEAFEAGIKAGASSALTAGILNAPVIDSAQGMQSINQLANVQTTGANVLGSFNAETFAQNLGGMALRGVVNAGVNGTIYGGSFGDAFKSSLISDLAAVGANAVGQGTTTLSPGNVIGHAAVGAVAAQLKGQDALSGAIGGAGGAIANPLIDRAIGGADGSGWGSDPQSAQQRQSATLQLGSMALSGATAAALGKDGMTAALAAQNETVNNFLTKENIAAKQARLAAATTPAEKAAIIKEYIGVSTDNTNKAFADLKTSVMTVADLEAATEKLTSLLSGPTACNASPACRTDVRNSISEISGILTSARAGDKMEPVVLAGELLLTVVTGGEYLAARSVGRGLQAGLEGLGAAEVAAGSSRRQVGFVFRGDARTPDLIFNEGLQARGTNTDLYTYALQNEPSVFVSTSKSPNVARDFADMQGGGYVYTIRGQSQGLDVNAILGKQSPFPHEFEIAVPGGIRPLDIMGARQVGPNGKFVAPFINNPTYVSPK